MEQLQPHSPAPTREAFGNLGRRSEPGDSPTADLFTRLGGFSQTAFIKAAFVYVGDIIGLSVADAIKIENDGSPDPARFASPEQAAGWLAFALWPNELPLVAVEIAGNGVRARLDPQAAAKHEAASRLIGQELAEHLSLSLAIGAGLLPSHGFRERLIVARGLYHAGATVELSDGVTTIWAHFGGIPRDEERETGESGVDAIRNLAGDAMAMTLPAKPGSLTEAAQVALAVDELKARGRCDA